jgi:hypothetical protein
MRITCVFFISFILYSCSDNGLPRGVLPPAKMQAVLWEFMQADVLTTDFIAKDSSKDLPLENSKLQAAIFTSHNITRRTFYDSYAYYEKHPERFRGVLDSIIERKGREQTQNRLPDTTRRKKLIDTTVIKAQ